MDIKTFDFEPIFNKIKQDPEAGYTDLVNATRDYVYFYSRSLLEDSTTAEDITQDVYIKVYKNIDTINDSKTFAPWLSSVIRNECYAYFRANKKMIDPETKVSVLSYDAIENFDLADETEEYQPEIKFDNDEKKRLVHQILDELSPIKKQVIMMRFFEDMKISEIAQKLGINENTVKTRIADAYKVIEEKVEELNKKHGIKLYSITPFAFFLWLLRGCKDTNVASTPLEQAKSKKIVERLFKDGSKSATAVYAASTATSASKAAATATKVGIAARLATIPAAVKVAIVAGIVALGITTGIVVNSINNNKIDTEPIVETLDDKKEETQNIINNDSSKQKDIDLQEDKSQEKEELKEESSTTEEEKQEEDKPTDPEEPDDPVDPVDPDEPDDPEEDKPVDVSELNTFKTLVLDGVEYNIIDIDVENNAATVTRSYLSEDSKTGFSNITGTYGSAYEGSLCQQYMNDYYNSLPDDIKSAIIPVTISGKSLGLLRDDVNEQYIEQDDIENQYVYPYRDTVRLSDNGEVMGNTASGYAVPEGYDISSMPHDGESQFFYWTGISWGATLDGEDGNVHPKPAGTTAIVGTNYPEYWQGLRAHLDETTDGTRECYNRPTFKISLDNVYQSQVEDKPY